MTIWKRIIPLILTAAACVAAATDLQAKVRSDSQNGWTLETGGVEYRLVLVGCLRKGMIRSQFAKTDNSRY